MYLQRGEWKEGLDVQGVLLEMVRAGKGGVLEMGGDEIGLYEFERELEGKRRVSELMRLVYEVKLEME